MSGNNFAVVLDLPVLTGDENYSIVLQKWLHKKEEITYLSYPAAKEYTKSLRLKRNPDKLWKITAVEVIGYYDSYEESKEKLNRLLSYKSSSESDSHHNNANVHTKQRKPKPTRNKDFDYDEGSLSPLTTPDDNAADDLLLNDLENVPVVFLPTIEEENFISGSDIIDNVSGIIEPNVSINSIYNLLKDVHSKMIKCEVILTSHTDRLINIEKKLNIIPQQEKPVVLKTKLPLQTIEMLEAFEDSLQCEEQSCALFSMLKNVSGSNERNCLFKLFAKVFDNKLGVTCSWKGRKQNYRIEHFILVKIILDAARHTFPNIKDQCVEQAGIDWFRFAQQRLSRATQKESTKNN